MHAPSRLILTHQSAESHNGKESLQKDPKRVHEGAILATSVITRRRGGECRRVGKGDNGQLCSTGTCSVLELGGHVGTAPSTHRTEKLDKNEVEAVAPQMCCVPQFLPAAGQLIDILN